MRVAQIEKRIAQAVATIRRFGFRLVADGDWGVDYKAGDWHPDEASNKEVCICGAIVLAENPKTPGLLLTAIARKLHITRAQAASLSDGFEGNQNPVSGHVEDFEYEIDKVWYRIGRKWRKRADEVRN